MGLEYCNQSQLEQLEHTCSILNEANTTAVGFASFLHWPLLFSGNPNTTKIECFLTDANPTTNILGIINAAVSFSDKKGTTYRVMYSVEESKYIISTSTQ